MAYHSKGSESKNGFSFRFLCTVSAFLFVLLLLCPLLPGGSKVNAQGNNDKMEADFLFQKPKTSFGFRIGLFYPKADSDLFDMITDELTLSKSDFRDWDFGIDFGYNLHEKIDLLFSLNFYSKTKNSEFRDYVDEQGLPITQSTKFSQTPLTVGIKYLLISRGRQVSQYSWVPSTIVPYISGGAGILWYEFRQNGDFVDFSTLEIFSATLKSSGGTFTGFLGCGAEINIYKNAFLNLDFRYYLADDDLSRDFVGFDSIELGGYRLTTGVHWHF